MFVLEGYETFQISLGGHEMTPNIGPGPPWTSIDDTSLMSVDRGISSVPANGYI